jgi:hypothetical protein
VARICRNYESRRYGNYVLKDVKCVLCITRASNELVEKGIT